MKVFLKKTKIKKDIIKIPDEWFPISLCYTSGTTGKPKGVVTHHGSAYLNSIFNQMVWNMKKKSSVFVDTSNVSLQWVVFSMDYCSSCWGKHLH